MFEAEGSSERALLSPVDGSLEPLSYVCSEDLAKSWQSITDKEFFSIDFWADSNG